MLFVGNMPGARSVSQCSDPDENSEAGRIRAAFLAVWPLPRVVSGSPTDQHEMIGIMPTLHVAAGQNSVAD